MQKDEENSKRKLGYFGYIIIRHTRIYELLQLIINGKIDGIRLSCRRRTLLLKNL